MALGPPGGEVEDAAVEPRQGRGRTRHPGWRPESGGVPRGRARRRRIRSRRSRRLRYGGAVAALRLGEAGVRTLVQYVRRGAGGGSLVPGSIGVKPFVTISALAERTMARVLAEDTAPRCDVPSEGRYFW
ncbi:hypothetical protein GCM10010121_089640 [Streptomyces brasiliensis]|uniref:Uncharacterized protein n=1 Tax=Streptomyces brasiliensis TaxID=1954 RepID=A0A917UL39_9ACTN|nr:hypothetical protein GCM10010121_089640 [Streptomyces brasiliensis]